jgi:hypothetical protein
MHLSTVSPDSNVLQDAPKEIFKVPKLERASPEAIPSEGTRDTVSSEVMLRRSPDLSFLEQQFSR